MKRRPNRIVHAPVTLQEQELEAIRGGTDLAQMQQMMAQQQAQQLALLQLQQQQQQTAEQIAAMSAAAKAAYDAQQEINRNLK